MQQLRGSVPLSILIMLLLWFPGIGLSAAADLQSISDNIATTPPMGWNSWNRFGCNIDVDIIKQTADAMVESGMKKAGYEYIVIDDCWQVDRNEKGVIIADPKKFPGGIKALADYVHNKGLKFGLYTDLGRQTCEERPGSLGFEQIDAETYASWGVDYVKNDWCHAEDLNPRTQYALMRKAYQSTKRPIVYSICNWGTKHTTIWAPAIGNLWRTTEDIRDRFASVLEILDINNRSAAVAGPGHWNDPDMLEVGNGGMSDNEYGAHFSLWALMAAPLMAGNFWILS